MSNIYYKRPRKLDTLGKNEKLDLMFDLIHAFRLVRTPMDTALLLQDLLTADEIRHLAIRLRIAKMFLSGAKYKDIIEKTHASSATIMKVGIWLDRGGDGLKSVIAKLPVRSTIPKDLPRGPIEYYLPQAVIGLAQEITAKNESAKLATFVTQIEDKKNLDASLQEQFDEHYRQKKVKKFKLL